MHAKRSPKAGRVISLTTAVVVAASNLNAAPFPRAFNRVEMLLEKGGTGLLLIGGGNMAGQKMIKPKEEKPVVKLPERMAKVVTGEEANVFVGEYYIKHYRSELESPIARYREEVYVSKKGLRISYDPSTDKITASETPAACRIEFAHDEYGIPVSYGSSPNDRTDRNRVGVRMFSGGDVTVTDTLTINQILYDKALKGTIKVRLDDVTASPKGAIVTIKNWHGEIVSENNQINEGDTLKITVGGKEYEIRCREVHPEATPKKWATIEVNAASLESLWRISRLDPDNDEISLAQEIKWGLLMLGHVQTTPYIKVRLDDVGAGPSHPAIVTIMDGNDNVISQEQVDPGEFVVKTVGGKDYGISCHATEWGSTSAEKLAEMSIYASEVILKNGHSFNEENGNNPDWEAGLVWTTNNEGIPCLKRITISTKVGVEEVVPKIREEVTVAPTLARGPVSFEYKGPIDKSAKLEIYDVAGRKVKTAEFGASQKMTVDVSDMAAGIYFAKFKFTIEGKKEETKKFTVL